MQIVLRYASGDVVHQAAKAPVPSVIFVKDADGEHAFRHVRSTLGMQVYEETGGSAGKEPEAAADV